MLFQKNRDKLDNHIAALLPPYKSLSGAVTRKRLLRFFRLYLFMALFGSCLFIFSHSTSLQTFGLGLILPGGGFIGHTDLFQQVSSSQLISPLFVITLFIFSLVIWFGTGNILAPPLVWLGSSVWAASISHGKMNIHALLKVSSIICLWCFFCALMLTYRHIKAKRQRLADNDYLLKIQSQPSFLVSSPASDEEPEMSLEDLQRLRFALDRALQPLDEFNGFEWLDQFQTAAVRYQINTLAYGNAMMQARFTPAFEGYMLQAQINLLDKQAQHKVWSYWRLENLWGNLKFNADPLARENIMFTGFVALQMALFEASTGCKEFSIRNRFKLIHPSGMEYAYNYAALVQCLEKEYKSSEFFLIACEPNWIYPLCNTIGASAILAFDAQNNHAKWKQIEHSLRHYLDAEFLDAFGGYVPCRSARTGLALPSIGGIMPQAMPCFFLNAIAPDLALRQWLLLRRKLFDKYSKLNRKSFWRIDTGNYRFSRASAYTVTALTAAELGDNEVYSICMNALEDECISVHKAGVIHRRNSSVWSHGIELMARASVKNGFRNLLMQPRKTTTMKLTNVNYPDILVASARADGDILKAVLYPGYQDGVYAITVAGLKPKKRYTIISKTTESVLSDYQGNVVFKLNLVGRTELAIYHEGTR